MDKKAFGTRGEALAKEHFIGRGFIILEENWRFRHLEIDIIAADDKTIVFAEVKTRTSGHPETISDMIDKQKQRNIIIAANAYIEKNEITKEARFDVLAITYENDRFHIDHIVDAFYPEIE